jgi:glucokinase
LPADVGAGGAAAVVHRATAGGERDALQAVELVVDCLAAVAGDHALAVLAHGGVFVAGGMAPRLLPWMRGGRFVAALRDKGVHTPLMLRFPVHVVLDEGLGLLGATALASVEAG